MMARPSQVIKIRPPFWLRALPVCWLLYFGHLALYASGATRIVLFPKVVEFTNRWDTWVFIFLMSMMCLWLLARLTSVVTITPSFIELSTWLSQRRIYWESADIIHQPGIISIRQHGRSITVYGFYAGVLRHLLSAPQGERVWRMEQYQAFLQATRRRLLPVGRFRVLVTIAAFAAACAMRMVIWRVAAAIGGLLLLANIASVLYDRRRERKLIRHVRACNFETCPCCCYSLQGLGAEGACPECSTPFSIEETRICWKSLIDGLRPASARRRQPEAGG